MRKCRKLAGITVHSAFSTGETNHLNADCFHQLSERAPGRCGTGQTVKSLAAHQNFAGIQRSIQTSAVGGSGKQSASTADVIPSRRTLCTAVPASAYCVIYLFAFLCKELGSADVERRVREVEFFPSYRCTQYFRTSSEECCIAFKSLIVLYECPRVDFGLDCTQLLQRTGREPAGELVRVLGTYVLDESNERRSAVVLVVLSSSKYKKTKLHGKKEQFQHTVHPPCVVSLDSRVDDVRRERLRFGKWTLNFIF